MFHRMSFLFGLLLCCVNYSYGDWVSEWMSPVHDLFSENQGRRENKNEGEKLYDPEEPQKMVQVPTNANAESHTGVQPLPSMRTNDDSTVSLKIKLEDAVQGAESLAQTLKTQIMALVAKETRLKDAIANGRSGVTTVTVQTLNQVPRTYIVREGVWTLCNGMVQRPADVYPTPVALLTGMFRSPRCIGQEMTSDQDPCVFNSMIKYETVPQQRQIEYAEDHFLCLKTSFNSTLEQFMSVPRHVVNDTCKNGVVRNINENIEQCSLRIMSEYTFYPHQSSAAAELPLEYCTERDGSCKLIVAWHIANSSVENFEFLKNEYNFKKYFLKAGPIKHMV